MKLSVSKLRLSSRVLIFLLVNANTWRIASSDNSILKSDVASRNDVDNFTFHGIETHQQLSPTETLLLNPLQRLRKDDMIKEPSTQTSWINDRMLLAMFNSEDNYYSSKLRKVPMTPN
jgi:hypothetical protein